MVVYNLPDIFQQKINDLFHGFEFIRAYLDNLLILKKGDWTDHVQKMELTLNKLKGKWLKFNIEKSLFGKTEMEYLGFWVTLDRVKPTNIKISIITYVHDLSSLLLLRSKVHICTHLRILIHEIKNSFFDGKCLVR